MALITLTTIIRAPAAQCCQLSLDADVHVQSMSHTNERPVAGRASGLFELGDTVTWEARHLGFVQRLTVQITALDFPSHFRDEMRRGIFKAMRHDHYFTEHAGVTAMRDEFYYEAPLGLLGRLAERLFLHRYMTRLVKQRNAVIKRIAEGQEL